MPDLQKTLLVRPGRDATPIGDLTSVTDFDRTELTSMASGGESGTSTWVVRNEDGTLPDRRLSVAKYLGPHNVVTVTVGSNTLFRGRISAADVVRGAQRGTRPQEQSYTLSDYNDDLRGIVVHEWDRPEETDAARAQALVARYLSGSPRQSTNLNGSNFVITGSNTTTLPAKTYSATSPMEVLQELAQTTDKEVFVDIDGNLHYHGHDYTGYDSILRISDDLADLNTVTCVPIEPSASEEGYDQISGIRSYYGDEQDRSVVVEDEFFQNRTDYWVEAFFDDAADTATEATRTARAILANRAREEKTYIVTIGKPGTIPNLAGNPMTGDDIWKVKPGQRILFKSRAVRGGLAVGGDFYGDNFLQTRVRSVTWTMPTADAYYARLELERPRRIAGLGNGRRQPKSTAAKPPPDCIPTSDDDVTVLSDSASDPSDWPGSETTSGACWGGIEHQAMGASGGQTSLVTVSAGDIIRGQLNFREETGNDSWENVDNYAYQAWLQFEEVGASLPPLQYEIVHQKYHNVGCINVTHERTETVPAGYNRARIVFRYRLGGTRYIGSISEVDPAGVPDNDDFCVPPGSGGESPFFARSDDPRFTNDDQHLITKLQQRVINNSGSTLSVGDIVVADTTQDDPSVKYATAASASDEGMVGIVTTAMADNETGVVMWQGNFLLPINDGSSTPAPGDYIYTSATDGAADFDNVRDSGAVGQVIATDASDNTTFILWWGNPDQPDATGGGSGATLVSKTADEVVNNSSALQDDNHLLFAMATNSKYEFELNGWFDSGTTPDYKHAFTVPSGATLWWSQTGLETSGTAANDAFVAVGSGTTNNQAGNGVGTMRHFRVKGFVETAGTSGNLQYQWCQNTANASDTTLHEGSTLKVWAL